MKLLLLMVVQVNVQPEHTSIQQACIMSARNQVQVHHLQVSSNVPSMPVTGINQVVNILVN